MVLLFSKCLSMTFSVTFWNVIFFVLFLFTWMTIWFLKSISEHCKSSSSSNAFWRSCMLMERRALMLFECCHSIHDIRKTSLSITDFSKVCLPVKLFAMALFLFNQTHLSSSLWNSLCIVGAHELLAIKLVLKERRHWMEQAEHLFVVFTDHDNPHYLQTTKHLNFCFLPDSA